MRRWLLLELCLSCLLFVAPAAADPSDVRLVPIRVEYQAPPDCPNSARFIAAMKARSARITLVPEDQEATLLRVSVGEDSAGGHWGSLQLLEDGSVTGRRRVDGASCAEVVEALGLAAALSVDPEALLGPPVAETSPGGKPAPQPTRLEPPTAPPVEPDRPAPPSRRWRPAIGGHAVLDGPLVPWVFYGGGVFASLERPPRGASFRLSTSLVQSRRNEAAFWALRGSISISPLKVVMGTTSAFEPVGLLDVGTLNGRGENLDVEQRASRLWLAVGAGGRFQVGISRTAFLEGEARLAVPLVKRSFVVDTPARTIADTPAITPSGRIGIGFHL